MKFLKHISLLLFLSFASTHGQQQIQIMYAGSLEFDADTNPGAQILTKNDKGQIHLVHDGINMWCNRAIVYRNKNFVEAFGDVIMKQGDTLKMTSKYAEYNGKTQLAFASGNVKLKDVNSVLTTDTLYMDRLKQQAYYKNSGIVKQDSSGTIKSKIGRYYMSIKKYQFVNDVVLTNPDYVIKTNFLDFYSTPGHAYLFGPSTITTKDSKTYCEKGFYNTNTKVGYAVKKSKIEYEGKMLEGDSLYIDNNRSFASATNNIKLTDVVNNTIIKGHYAEAFRDKDSAFVTKRAVAITIRENDSTYIHSDSLLATGKADHRVIKAYYNARIYKSDLSGKADSIHMDKKTGVTKLINIDRFSSKDKFSKKRNPIIWNIHNQMTGDTIHMYANNKTEKLDSLTVFYNVLLISKDTVGDGFNQLTGKKLIGLFNDSNDLREVSINKNAESIYYTRNENNELMGIDKTKSGVIKIFFLNNEIEEIRKLNQVDGNLFKEQDLPEKDRIFRNFNWREEERIKSVQDLFKDDPPLKLPIIKGLEDYVPQDKFFAEENTETNTNKKD